MTVDKTGGMSARKAIDILKILSRGCIATLCLFALEIAPSLAVEVIPDFYKDPGIDVNRDYVNQHQTEHIDPFTGALQIQSTDIHLPSRGGFELNVIRSYNSASIDNTAPLNYSSMAGLGWQIHFGRVLSKSNTNFSSICTVNNTGSTTASPVLELPDGSRQVLYNGVNGNPTLITKQRWKATCANNGLNFVVYSPDGVRYDMTQVVTDANLPGVTAVYTTKITDRNGNSATIVYPTANSSIISTVSTAEVTLYFAYETLQSWETHPRISTISGPAGLIWRYGYTATLPTYLYQNSYQLTKVTRPDGTFWQYGYNNGDITGAGGYLMNSMTYPQGGTINYGYTLLAFDPLNYPAVKVPVVTSKSTSDGTWTFAYTPGGFNNPDKTVVSLPSGIGNITYKHIGINYTATGNNPVWGIGLLLEKSIGTLQTETYTWDKQQVSQQQDLRPGRYQAKMDAATYAPLITNKVIVRDGGSTTYTTTYPIANYDSYGNPGLINETGPQGGNRSTLLTYYINPSSWIVKQKSNETTSGVGSVVRTWDSFGNLKSITQDGVTTSYPSRFNTGDVQTMTDPLGNVTTYANYVCGIPQNEAHPEGVNISRVVNSLGNVVSETDGENHTHTYGYDVLNRLTSITNPIHNSTIITYTVNGTVKTAARADLVEITNYDSYGRPTKVTMDGHATTYNYDALGRMTFKSDPDAVPGPTYPFATPGTNLSYDILNRVTRITNADSSFKRFDYAGNVTTITDERSNVTKNTYRAYGDPDKQYLMSSVLPVASMSITIARNGRDQVTSVAQNGVTRSYGYNASNGYYLTSVTQPEIGTTNYGRDAAGNMTSKDINGTLTTTYVYDNLNRLKTIAYPAGGNTPAVTKTYTNTSKLKTVSTSVATRTYAYDPNDNMTSETLNVADGAQSFTATYGYDGNDQLATITYPTSGMTLSYTPDNLNRPTTAITPSTAYVNSVSYWPSGQVYQIAYGNGTTSTYGQNARLWPSSFATTKGAAAPYVNNVYDGYYATGDLTHITDTVDGTHTRGLDYDAVGRLTTVNGPWGGGSITYDGNGNITNQTFGSAALNYVYDTSSRLASVSGTRNTGIGYDVYGNVASADNNTFGYDDAPNLVRFNFGKANEIDYQYDGTNMRVLTNKGGVKTYEFYSNNGNLLQEYTPSQNNLLTEYIYLGDKRVAQRVQYNLSLTVSLTSSANPVLVGQPTTLTVMLAGQTTPTGNVTISDNGTVLSTIPLVNGKAQLVVTLNGLGIHNIFASYSGDANYTPSSSAVLSEYVKAASSTSINASSNPSIVGNAISLTATVSGSVAATGSVTFMNGSASLGSATVVNNSASLSVSGLPIGYYAITGAYSGDATNIASTSSVYNLIVNDLTQSSTAFANPPAIVGVNQVIRPFKVEVQGLNPTGIVTISEGPTQLASVPLTYDSASQKYYAQISSLIFTTLGQHTLTAQYAGDTNNKPSSATAIISVNTIDPAAISVILQMLLD